MLSLDLRFAVGVRANSNKIPTGVAEDFRMLIPPFVLSMKYDLVYGMQAWLTSTVHMSTATNGILRDAQRELSSGLAGRFQGVPDGPHGVP